MSAVAEVLVEMRKASGAKQADVAAHLGVAQPTVAHWEAGRHEPPDGVWEQLSRYYQARLTRSYRKWVESQQAANGGRE